MKHQGGLEVAGVKSASSHKWAARLRSVGIRRFELVARRLAGYAVVMEVARRAEGPEVNGDLRKTVSRRSLVPSQELKRKGYSDSHVHPLKDGRRWILCGCKGMCRSGLRG